MVKHIVGFTFKDGVEKESTVKFVAGLLEPLVGQIPGLLAAEVRPCFQGSVDFCLYSELESREALAVYAEHPLHIAAKDQFFHLLSGRVASDYEV